MIIETETSEGTTMDKQDGSEENADPNNEAQEQTVPGIKAENHPT